MLVHEVKYYCTLPTQHSLYLFSRCLRSLHHILNSINKFSLNQWTESTLQKYHACPLSCLLLLHQLVRYSIQKSAMVHAGHPLWLFDNTRCTNHILKLWNDTILHSEIHNGNRSMCSPSSIRCLLATILLPVRISKYCRRL